MQAAREATARRLRLAAALFLAVMAVFAATASGVSADTVCGPPTLKVCVSVVPDQAVDPVTGKATVAPSVDDTPTGGSFASYTVTVSNQANRTVTHVTLGDVAVGGRLVSATPVPPTTATCTPDGGQCVFGNLPSGAQVSVTITVKAPVLVPPATTGEITNTATVSFDENFNDSPTADPKQDTVTASGITNVATLKDREQSAVPPNTEVQLDTDPTHRDTTSPADPNIGQATVPATDHATITASLEEVPGSPPPCPKKEICRTGAWVRASIPGLFLTTPLTFIIHWNKTLVPKSQSTKNLNVLKTECLTGCPVVVISRRCTSSTPPTPGNPCLTNVAEDATEFRATVLSSENGYMR